MNQFSTTLNDLHDESRAYSNVIPNTGVNVLSGVDIMDSVDNLRSYINAGFRDLFFRALDFHAEFEVFVEEIEEYTEDYIHQLTACFRSYPRFFENEAYQDLRSISECPATSSNI